MELGYVIKNNTTGKAYKHFSINAVPSTKEPLEPRDNVVLPNQKPEFFFIGRSNKKIDILIQLFEGGYAAENVKSAINILKRLPGSGQSLSSIAVIIVDSVFGEAGINELNSYISKTKDFCDLPLMLEASDLSKDVLVDFRKLNLVDEFIFLGQGNDKLLAKVEFLQKLKAKSNEDAFRKNINTSANENSLKLPAGYVF